MNMEELNYVFPTAADVAALATLFDKSKADLTAMSPCWRRQARRLSRERVGDRRRLLRRYLGEGPDRDKITELIDKARSKSADNAKPIREPGEKQRMSGPAPRAGSPGRSSAALASRDPESVDRQRGWEMKTRAAATRSSKGKPGPAAVKLEACVAWLRDRMASGPASLSEVRHDAALAGFSAKTLYRAKDALGVDDDLRDGRRWWSPPSVQHETLGVAPDLVASRSVVPGPAASRESEPAQRPVADDVPVDSDLVKPSPEPAQPTCWAGGGPASVGAHRVESGQEDRAGSPSPSSAIRVRPPEKGWRETHEKHPGMIGYVWDRYLPLGSPPKPEDFFDPSRYSMPPDDRDVAEALAERRAIQEAGGIFDGPEPEMDPAEWLREFNLILGRETPTEPCAAADGAREQHRVRRLVEPVLVAGDRRHEARGRR